MAVRYRVNGGGNWNDTAKWSASSGGASGASVPTSADDAIFDANSGTTFTVDLQSSTRSCKTLTISSGLDITFEASAGSIKYLDVYGDINIQSTDVTIGVSFYNTTLRMRASGTLTMPNNNSIDFAFQGGEGATYTLGSNITIPSTVGMTLVEGTLTTSASNYSISVGSFVISGTVAKVLTLNGSSFTITGTDGIDLSGGTNLTVNAGTSTLTYIRSGGAINLAGYTFNKVVLGGGRFNFPTNITGNIVCSTFELGAVGYFKMSANITASTFTAVNTGGGQRSGFYAASFDTPRTISAATVTIEGIDFGGITATGGGTWAGTSIGNLGANTGITFTPAVNRYGVVANGTTNEEYYFIGWATTSGGATGASDPLPQDTVYLDANSGTGTYGLSQLICSSLQVINFAGRLYGMSTSDPAYVLGSVNFNSASVVIDATFELHLAGSGSHTLYAIGDRTLSYYIGGTPFSNVGTYTLTSNLSCTGLYPDGGTFTAGTYNVTLNEFDSGATYASIINMGSGTWTLDGSATNWNASGGLTTINKQTATITINSTDTTVTFTGGNNNEYPKITIAGSTAGQTVTFNSNIKIAELASTKTIAHTVRFTAATTTQFDAFTVSGSAGNVVTVNSTSTTTPATLLLASGWNIGVNSTATDCTGINLTAGSIDYLAFVDINGITSLSSFLVMF